MLELDLDMLANAAEGAGVSVLEPVLGPRANLKIEYRVRFC